MDVDLSAGGNGSRRKVDIPAVAEATVDIIPLELYDSARAKIAANLRWLFAKAYGIENIPEDLRDPFYTDQYDQEHIKPPVIHLLLSSELYCRVCSLILKTEQAASLQSHMSVIHSLSRKGIYVVESDDTPVADEDLSCMPIKMSAHMSMIDALMMAYTVEMISIEKVVASVKRFSTFRASKELPFDLEDAMVFWINKVNMKMREITEREHKVKHHPLESPSHQKSPSKWYWKLVPVRYRRDHASGRQLPFFRVLEDLMRDICDGAALLTLVHCYCPDLMKLEDICLKEVPSIADSLYNIQLLREFANEYLNKSFYLTIEDMLYSPLVLKHNIMVFIAELFWWFETVKPEFVQPRDLQEFKDCKCRTLEEDSTLFIKSVCLNKEEESGEGPCSSGWGSLHRGDGSTSAVPVTTKDPNWTRKAFEDDEEEESAKLQEDMNVKEHEDKDLNGGSGRSSPCLSTHSQASSMASGSVRMTSFAERKAQQQRFGSNHDLYSSATSSQRTTPDGSESSGPLNSWRLKRDQSPSSPMGGWSRTGDGGGSANVLASELVQLHMQLEEKRRAIEHQKKKRDLLMARQRQKLGKAAFLNIVKKDGGRSDAFPNPLKADIPKDELGGEKAPPSKELMCAGTQKGDRELEGTFLPGALEADEKENNGNFCPDEELDPYECSRSIEQLNEAINSIQQQMMQVSLKQELLIKQNVQSPPGASPTPPLAAEKNGDSKAGASFHFVDHVSGSSTVPTRKPPKLSSSRGSRSKPSELKLGKEQSRVASKALHPAHSGSKTLPQTRHLEGGRSPKRESPRTPVKEETAERPGDVHTTFRLNDEANIRLPTRVDLTAVAAQEVSFEECLSSTMKESELNSSDGSGRENIPSEVPRSKAPLIEVDLSELKSEEDEAVEDANSEGGEGEQKSVLGFFFKDDRKAEGDLAKKKAAFLLKQQKKAEEARLRRQQLEAESELKRDEARRKAEEDRLRKEEEKMRRELIKQEYQQRKQQEMFEEQKLSPKLFKPKTPKPKQRPRPKSVLREESSIDVSKDSSTRKTNRSLISAAASSCDSVESFTGSVNSRATERDWDNGSTASSTTAKAEYTGLKLFKEPSAKSNKPIIHNAISHCCLAGKVNEPQKKQILEELEKCESNHLMILFRDSGCQFRALYSYFPDTEEILKLTGTGPKSISKKMIDKLYKYNSDRKQFTVIPAKTVSVSVDAITIHNHLWQAKKTSVPKKNGK
uniref:Calmodulin regulated spectrin-associated protein 1b n=1 Tax=Takifugu rubripes TaxID=31033 RepID=A0A674NIQ1_TAKRU